MKTTFTIREMITYYHKELLCTVQPGSSEGMNFLNEAIAKGPDYKPSELVVNQMYQAYCKGISNCLISGRYCISEMQKALVNARYQELAMWLRIEFGEG